MNFRRVDYSLLSAPLFCVFFFMVVCSYRSACTVLSVFYDLVFQIRDWVVADVAYFAWFSFANPKGFGSLTRKGCLVTNVLDSSLDLGSITYIL